MFKTYYRLTKPGIIYGNLLSTAAGFLLAAGLNVNLFLLSATLLGTALIIASACVFNNYLDRDIDAKMERTKKRALVRKAIPVANALIYGSVLGLLGSFILLFFVNLTTFLVGFTGFIFYVFLYTFIKRHSVYGTLIGSVSGATPPVAGYTAVTGSLDVVALLLFIALVVWQMPHFYSIAIFRINDYKAAKIPVLPIVRGIKFTKITMLGYIVLFISCCSVMTIAGFTGYIFLVLLAAAGVYWLTLGIKGFQESDSVLWARKMFKTSLIVLLIFCATLALEVVLP